MKYKGEEIKNSPIQVKVRTASAQHSYLEEKKYLFEDVETSLKIISVDEDGNKLTDGGETFQVSFKIDSQEQQVFFIPKNNKFFLELKKKKKRR